MSEFKFSDQNSNLFNQNVDETSTYVSVLGINKYEFMNHAYYGTGGFRDGSFLVCHPREMFYKARKEISSYRNFVKPICDSLLTPVFNEEAIRSSDSDMFDAFLENVDNCGTDMQHYVEQATMYSRLHGVAFIVMDNFPREMQPDTMEQAVANRIMPYVYTRQANDVESYDIDQFGNITSITFIEQPIIIDGKKEARYRIWTNMYSQVLKKSKEGYEPIGESAVHGLGVIPVIAAYSCSKKTIGDVLVDPPLYDIARLNHQLYNKDSSIIDQERAQAFSNFYIQGDNGGNITLGTHNVIFVPMEATMSPGFASPDSSILKGLVDNAEQLKNSIYQIAQQNGVYGIQEAKSGLAMSYDFYAQEYQLRKTAQVATYIEQRIADLFGKYTNTEIEYVVEYSDEFQPGNSKAIIDTYKVVLDLGVPDEFKKAIFEKCARMLFSDEDEDKLKLIIDDIYAEDDEEDTNLNPNGDTNGDNIDTDTDDPESDSGNNGPESVRSDDD